MGVPTRNTLAPTEEKSAMASSMSLQYRVTADADSGGHPCMQGVRVLPENSRTTARGWPAATCGIEGIQSHAAVPPKTWLVTVTPFASRSSSKSGAAWAPSESPKSATARGPAGRVATGAVDGVVVGAPFVGVEPHAETTRASMTTIPH